MISHKHKFIFIHIPKTAGTSVEEALRDESCQLLPDEWDHARVPHAPLNHLTLQELADYDILTPAQLNSYFKFCFVRNPWDRLVSEVFCPWMSPWFKDLPVDQRIRRACELAATPPGIANHLLPQQDFVTADNLQMDFIGRFEHLDEDFGQLCRLLGIKVTLPHRNRSLHRPYQEYYDTGTQALVHTAYQRDIDAFHYTFGDAKGGQKVVRPTQQKDAQPMSKRNQNRVITAYPLYDRPAPLQPVADDSQPRQHPAHAARNFAGAAWQVCCPVAFEATWNGGAKPDDIEIRLTGDAPAQPAFVQSNLGEGLLTFYPGYQFKVAGEHQLWVSGPSNGLKDGIAPLESLVDASLLPCTVAIHWQFTRAHQTIRFAAGEPFATLLLYPKSGPAAMTVEEMQTEVSEEAYLQAFQQMSTAPALQSLFQQLAAPVDSVGQMLPRPGG